LVAGVYLAAPTFLKTLENKLYDLHFTLRGVRHPGEQVTIVAVDDQSLTALGRWPWPRSLLAQMVDTLTEAGAKVIAIDILLSERKVDGAARAPKRLAQRSDALGGPPKSPAGQALRTEAAAVEQGDSDTQLARAIQRSGRVILPIVFDLRLGLSTT